MTDGAGDDRPAAPCIAGFGDNAAVFDALELGQVSSAGWGFRIQDCERGAGEHRDGLVPCFGHELERMQERGADKAVFGQMPNCACCHQVQFVIQKSDFNAEWRCPELPSL